MHREVTFYRERQVRVRVRVRIRYSARIEGRKCSVYFFFLSGHSVYKVGIMLHHSTPITS